MNLIEVAETQQDEKYNERRQRVCASFIDSSTVTHDDRCDKQKVPLCVVANWSASRQSTFCRVITIYCWLYLFDAVMSVNPCSKKRTFRSYFKDRIHVVGMSVSLIDDKQLFSYSLPSHYRTP